MTSHKTIHHFRSMVTVFYELVSFSIAEFKDLSKIQAEYISRFAFNVFNNYEKLTDEDKKTCKNELVNVKNKILNNDAYGNKALKMRCYGKAFWFIYKVFEKTVGRLFI